MFHMMVVVHTVPYIEVCVCVVFPSAKDLTVWKLFDPCVQLLKNSVESIGLDKEVFDFGGGRGATPN